MVLLLVPARLLLADCLVRVRQVAVAAVLLLALHFLVLADPLGRVRLPPVASLAAARHKAVVVAVLLLALHSQDRADPQALVHLVRAAIPAEQLLAPAAVRAVLLVHRGPAASPVLPVRWEARCPARLRMWAEPTVLFLALEELARPTRSLRPSSTKRNKLSRRETTTTASNISTLTTCAATRALKMCSRI